MLTHDIISVKGFGVEMFITMVVVLTVFAAAADENNAINVKYDI